MKSRLVNVRLDAERVRKARALRDQGIVLSDLVREAIDHRYDALGDAQTPRDAKALIARVFERYPDPANNVVTRDYDVHSAGEARAAVRRALSRRRP